MGLFNAKELPVNIPSLLQNGFLDMIVSFHVSFSINAAYDKVIEFKESVVCKTRVSGTSQKRKKCQIVHRHVSHTRDVVTRKEKHCEAS